MRQNERASVVTCGLSSVGLASSVSGLSFEVDNLFLGRVESEIMACDPRTNLLLCAEFNKQFLLFFMQL